MKFYRNRAWTTAEGSKGYCWFANKAAALAEAKENPEDYEEGPPLCEVAELFDIPRTKEAILALLQDVASHNNNG